MLVTFGAILTWDYSAPPPTLPRRPAVGRSTGRGASTLSTFAIGADHYRVDLKTEQVFKHIETYGPPSPSLGGSRATEEGPTTELNREGPTEHAPKPLGKNDQEAVASNFETPFGRSKQTSKSRPSWKQ